MFLIFLQHLYACKITIFLIILNTNLKSVSVMLIIKNIILLFGFHVIIFYCHAALPASTNHVFF